MIGVFILEPAAPLIHGVPGKIKQEMLESSVSYDPKRLVNVCVVLLPLMT